MIRTHILRLIAQSQRILKLYSWKFCNFPRGLGKLNHHLCYSTLVAIHVLLRELKPLLFLPRDEPFEKTLLLCVAFLSVM
jgi:hypothetical protein